MIENFLFARQDRQDRQDTWQRTGIWTPWPWDFSASTSSTSSASSTLGCVIWPKFRELIDHCKVCLALDAWTCAFPLPGVTGTRCGSRESRGPCDVDHIDHDLIGVEKVRRRELGAVEAAKGSAFGPIFDIFSWEKRQLPPIHHGHVQPLLSTNLMGPLAPWKLMATNICCICYGANGAATIRNLAPCWLKHLVRCLKGNEHQWTLETDERKQRARAAGLHSFGEDESCAGEPTNLAAPSTSSTLSTLQVLNWWKLHSDRKDIKAKSKNFIRNSQVLTTHKSQVLRLCQLRHLRHAPQWYLGALQSGDCITIVPRVAFFNMLTKRQRLQLTSASKRHGFLLFLVTWAKAHGRRMEGIEHETCHCDSGDSGDSGRCTSCAGCRLRTAQGETMRNARAGDGWRELAGDGWELATARSTRWTNPSLVGAASKRSDRRSVHTLPTLPTLKRSSTRWAPFAPSFVPSFAPTTAGKWQLKWQSLLGLTGLTVSIMSFHEDGQDGQVFMPQSPCRWKIGVTTSCIIFRMHPTRPWRPIGHIDGRMLL